MQAKTLLKLAHIAVAPLRHNLDLLNQENFNLHFAFLFPPH